MARGEEIDTQFPWIQVARGVGARAAQLAGPLGITYQHARGALDVLWENFADRRILAKALEHPQKAVAIGKEEIHDALKVAFGMPVPPGLLVSAGFLEPLGDGTYRLRGMSRYVEAEETRLARKGDSRQTRSGGQLRGSTGVRHPRLKTEDGRHETRELKDHDHLRQSDLIDDQSPPTPEPERQPSRWQESWELMQILRQKKLGELGLEEAEPEPHSPATVNTMLSRASAAVEVTAEQLVEVWQRYLEWEDAAKKDPPYPLQLFCSKGTLQTSAKRWRETSEAA